MVLPLLDPTLPCVKWRRSISRQLKVQVPPAKILFAIRMDADEEVPEKRARDLTYTMLGRS